MTVLDELGELHGLLANDAPALAFTRRALAMCKHERNHEDAERLRARLEKLERKLAEN